MLNEEMEDGELLSALADGELQGEDFTRAMAEVAASEEAGSRWHAYHVAGDVLRSADLGDCRGDRNFLTRLRTRLALTEELEQVVVVGGTSDGAALAPIAREHLAVTVESANDAVVRWKWLAAAASVAAVGTMGWYLSQIDAGGSAQLALAAAGNSVAGATAAQPSTDEPPHMLRDPRLDELLAAHRQLGGTSALQMPAGFLRNATFDQSGR